MDIAYKEKIVAEKTVEVDDRLYSTDEPAWKIANIIHGNLERGTKDLYCEDARTVLYSAQRINDAFVKADRIIGLIVV